jgi:hypothetical protein
MANVSLTNYASQVAEIERQKKLAELLQQQAQQPIEIQSYKGTQAPIPWSAVLAKVLGQVGGQIKEARAIKQAGALKEAGMAEALRQYGDTNKMAEQLTPMAQAPSGPSMATPAQTAIALGGVPTLGGSVGPSAPQAGMMPGMKAAAPPVAAPAPPPRAQTFMTPQEQQAAGRRLAVSGLPTGDILGAAAVRTGEAAQTREQSLEDEKRELRNKIYTSGAGDTSFTVDPITGQRTVINVNPKAPQIKSAIDPTTGQVVSWTLDDQGKATMVTSGEFTPTTEKEYNKLPKGTQYIGADGSTRVKT